MLRISLGVSRSAIRVAVDPYRVFRRLNAVMMSWTEFGLRARG